MNPTITAPCGHTEDFDAFTRAAVSGDLPPGNYQCPVCGFAWAMRHIGQAAVYPSGLVVPPPLKAIPVEPVL